jgi:hypothetical protein
LGATNYVVRPRDWDEYGQQVKSGRPGAARVQVPGEDRELTARDGASENDFTAYAVHLYRLDGP